VFASTNPPTEPPCRALAPFWGLTDPSPEYKIIKLYLGYPKRDGTVFYGFVYIKLFDLYLYKLAKVVLETVI
jgi:hypothetical protein